MKQLILLTLLFFTTAAQANQWVYQKLDGDKIKNIWKRLGDNKVIVAVIDSGVDYTHADLAKRMWINKAELNGLPGVDDDNNGYVDDLRGYNFAEKNNDPMDLEGHGTHVAGIIAGIHNDIGINGINPNAIIMPLKSVATRSGEAADSAEAIIYAVDNGAQVINCSWTEPEESPELIAAVEYAESKGVIIVAAAGNSGKDLNRRKLYLTDFDSVISVANHESSGRLASRSNYGAKKVDISGPGQHIYSSIPGNKYEYRNGTSMASPFVAGAISLLLSLEPGHDFESIKNRLYRTGDYSRHLKKKLKSERRINVYNFIMDIEE